MASPVTSFVPSSASSSRKRKPSTEHSASLPLQVWRPLEAAAKRLSSGSSLGTATPPPAATPPPLRPGSSLALAPPPSAVPCAPCATLDQTDHATLMACPLTIVIFGATGDLARKKLFPALYALCSQGHLPRHVNIVGYGRRAVDLPDFVAKQCVNVAEGDEVKWSEANTCPWSKAEFAARISFHAGGYDAPSSYQALDATLRVHERAHPSGRPGNRLYFLSVPPTVFGVVCEQISLCGRAAAGGFTRLMIEKPFGRDSRSFHELNALTARHFRESQLFRIDHYLGKEILLNISTLRWANAIFEPLWSRQHIESVQLTFKEDLGTDGRGGYFDSIGIIRDIIQNHLLQAFMFLAMEPPESMASSAILASKVELLRTVRTLDLHAEGQGDVYLGQFAAGNGQRGYTDDATVPAGSTCPTFAACVLTVDNERWRGVPFLLSAGKGLDERLCEVRVRFKPQPYNRLMGVDAANELVMRVQPDEALYMVAVAKTPGICSGVSEERRTPVAMGLRYATQFGDGSPFKAGDAYERMLLNAARGDQALSVSADELHEAWRIFTPLLHQIDDERPAPVTHAFGEHPGGYDAFTRGHGIDIEPPALHWSAKEAEAHAARSAASLAAAQAAAQAESRAADPFSDPSFAF